MKIIERRSYTTNYIMMLHTYYENTLKTCTTKLFTQYLLRKLTLQIKMTYLSGNDAKYFFYKFY